MTMESGLLLLESVLLVATVALLLYNIHEGKQREILLRGLERAAKVLSRQEYFLSLMDAMLEAKREIIGCVTGRPPSGDDLKMTKSIVEAIEKMTKKGVRIRYLLPKFPDRLQMGIQYTKAGAEVFFSSCLLVHNMRYSVIDDRTVVLGIPESIGEKEATKKGYRIISDGLAGILKSNFDSCERQVGLKDYLREVIEQTGATPEHLAAEFRLDVNDLKKYLP